MAKTIVNTKEIHLKGKTHKVEKISPVVYKVISGSSGSTYWVRLSDVDDGAICSCPWGKYRPRAQQFKSGCSHSQAVYQFILAEQGRTTSAWGDKESARRQHRPIVDLSDGVLLTTRKARESAERVVERMSPETAERVVERYSSLLGAEEGI